MPAILLINTVHGHGYGAESALGNLLNSWTSPNLELVLLTPAGTDVEEIARRRNFRVIHLPAARDSIRLNLPALLKTLPRCPPADLAHAWHGRGFELAAMAGLRLRAPSCGTQHDHPQAAFHGFFRRRVMRTAARRFSKLVCVSRAVEKLCPAAGFHLPTRVIWNGLPDVPAPQPRMASPRVRVGFLGMYSIHKGFDILQNWIARTADLPAEWHLYGEVAPELRAPSEALARQEQGRVFVHGHVAASEIYSQLDMVVQCSTHFESFGLVLVEAMRAGIPFVASNLGGPSEIAAQSRAGYLFDPAAPDPGLERARELIASPARRNEMGKSGRKEFEQSFRATTMCASYESLWLDILRERSLKP